MAKRKCKSCNKELDYLTKETKTYKDRVYSVNVDDTGRPWHGKTCSTCYLDIKAKKTIQQTAICRDCGKEFERHKLVKSRKQCSACRDAKDLIGSNIS